MLANTTKMKTNWGDLPISKCMNGVYIETPDGYRIVTGKYKKIHGSIRYAFVFYNGKRIDFDNQQFFFTPDLKPIRGIHLKNDDFIYTKEGPWRIKQKRTLKSKFFYYGLYVNNFDNKQYLANGIMVK